MPRGLKRTGQFRSQMMPVCTASRDAHEEMPVAYAIAGGDTRRARVLRMHGVQVEPLANPWPALVQRYVIDSVHHADASLPGAPRDVACSGTWRDTLATLPAGSRCSSRGAQPLGVVAFFLLEPKSDDGLVTWNFFDAAIAPGFTFPVWRIPGAAGGLNHPASRLASVSRAPLPATVTA